MKYKLNTPKSTLRKIDNILSIPDVPDKHKKVMKEIRGILVGKYPNQKALENSIKGVRKKIETIQPLQEARRSKLRRKIDRAIVGIGLAMASMTAILPGAMETAAGQVKNYQDSSRGSIARQASSVLGGASLRQEIEVLTVRIPQEEWNKIEEAFDRFEEAVRQDRENVERHADQLKGDLGKQGVEVRRGSTTRTASGNIVSYSGFFEAATGKIIVANNWFQEAVSNFSRNLNSDDLLQLKTTIRHELTHKHQFDLNSSSEFVNKFMYSVKNAMTGDIHRRYDNKLIEIGAFYNQLDYSFNQTDNRSKIDASFRDIEVQMIRNIIDLYGEDDPVVKKIREFLSTYNRYSYENIFEFSKKQYSRDLSRMQEIKDHIDFLKENRKMLQVVKTNADLILNKIQ